MVEVSRGKIEGVAELKAALTALGPEVATKTGAAANRRAAVVLRDALKDHAPVGEQRSPKSKIYGRLRDNIRVAKKKAAKQHHIVHWVTIGRAFWGFFQEFGTLRMAARPWFRPVLTVVQDRIRAAQIDELKKGIERAAKRLARIRRR